MPYLIETEVEAECPSCGDDLICPTCDRPSATSELDGILLYLLTTKANAQLFALYTQAIDEGRLTDAAVFHALYEATR
jgi:RNA polymerase subunit RPABC4/transcription elongation factor Spt4